MLLSRLFVARLHVKKRQVCVHQLFFGAQGLRLVTFGDCGREIPFSVMAHRNTQLGVKMAGVLFQNGLQLINRRIVTAGRIIEHGVVVSFLMIG